MANDLIVVKVDRARALLAEARDATDAKKVADLARAAEVYAKRQKLSEEAIAYATAVKVDALTLMGEFLKATPKNKGAKGVKFTGSSFEPVKDDTPTLNSSGISKRESSEAQALAKLAEEQPDLHEQVRDGKLSVPKARVEKKRREKRADSARKAALAPPLDEDAARVIRADVLDGLAQVVEIGTPRLIFADPPYNIGVDYGDGEKADRLPETKYLDWCREWVQACADLLAKDGSLWVLIGDEYADHFGLLLRGAGLHRRAWIKWYETFGVNCANNFNRCSRHLFYCVKDPRQFVFNAEAVNRPSDRQTKYGDRRADPGGKVWDDVWLIPRLVGTAKERIPDFPTQLPLDLLRPIIGCATDPGELVLDPFSGSATTGVAAVELGRRFIGVEKSKRFADLSIQRLKESTYGEDTKAS